jgi:transposase InsO family protein
MCSILKVSRSSYYNWLNCGPSKRWLSNERIMYFIQKIFQASYQSYGTPRIKKELEKYGHFVSRKRISKLMKLLGLFVKRSYKIRGLTDSNHKYPVAPNLLNQNFNVDRENQVWVSDMTYIATKQGWMYLTVIIDLFNRKVVGWSFSKDLTTDNTIISAWKMAVSRNQITKDLIFHSDRGSQYASRSFTDLIKSYNGLIKQSMSRKGNCWDNAVAESFFKSLKAEWVYRYQYKTRSQAELSVFKWIETWYNRKRLHSALGLKSIEEFEQEMNNQKLAA